MKINSRIKKKTFSTVTAAFLAAAVIVGGGKWLGIMQGNADSSDLVISLSEPAGENCGYSYNVVPGKTDTKDPVITLSNASEAYVFVEVTDTVNKNGSIVQYSMADGWEDITSSVTSKKHDEVTAVYAKKIAAGTNRQLQILDSNKVSYDIGLTNEDLMKITDGSNTLVFKAKAIEAAPFTNEVDAYNKFDVTEITATITTKIALNEALANENNEDNSILCNLTDNLGDGHLFSTDSALITISLNNKYKNITINGNGHSIAFDAITGIDYGTNNQSLVLRNVTVNDKTGAGILGSRTVININEDYSGATLVLDNVTVKTERISGGYNTNNAIMVGGDNSTVKISDSIITVDSNEYAIKVTGSNDNVFIDSGTITGKLDFGSADVEITGGTFINSKLKYSQITSYVGSDYKATAYNNINGGGAVQRPKDDRAYTRYVVTKK